MRPVPVSKKNSEKNGLGRGGMGYNSGAMSMDGKTEHQLRMEFYESLRLEREEAYRRAREEREEMYRVENEKRERFEEEMRRRWDRVAGEWGSFTNDEGGMVEYEGVAAFRDMAEIGGMPIDDIVYPLQLGKKQREYDGLIRCPEAGAVVLVEFKRRLTVGAVRKFVDEQLPAFLRDFPGMVGDGKLYGAVVGASVDAAARKLAEENGLFAVRLPANRRTVVLNDKARPVGR